MTGASRHRAAGGLLLGLALLAGCHTGSRQTDVEMEVRRVAVDPASQSPVVLLENHDHTLILPIWIGLSEAQAIAMQIEGVDPPRPLTHDLVKTVFDRIGVQLNKVLISELRGSTYYARLFLASNGTEWEIDSRPSDAIALAMRCRKPILVAAALLEHAETSEPKSAVQQSATIGGVTVQVLSKALAEHFDVPAGHGVLVADVRDDAGGELLRGDIILEVDGDPVQGVADFRDRVSALAGRTYLSVKRGGEEMRLAFEAPVD